MISPNKQNLILLKQQKKLTQNGHKLLKEKRNGLIINFLQICKEGKSLEQELLSKINGFLEKYNGITSFISTSQLLDALTKTPGLSLMVEKKRLSGVYINQFILTVEPPQRELLKKVLQDVLSNFGELFKGIVELSQTKINAENISLEIHKTNRQISNLEQKIEQIEQDIKYIKSALMEKENYEKSVLMKIFN